MIKECTRPTWPIGSCFRAPTLQNYCLGAAYHILSCRDHQEPIDRDDVGQVRFRGWLAKAGEFASHRQMGQMPRSLHLLDDVMLGRAAAGAGLAVERVWLYRRPDFPRTLHLDGRESAALIAVKL